MVAGLLPYAPYYFMMRAVGPSGASALTDRLRVVTGGSSIVGEAPRDFRAVPDGSNVRLMWSSTVGAITGS